MNFLGTHDKLFSSHSDYRTKEIKGRDRDSWTVGQLDRDFQLVGFVWKLEGNV